MIPPMGKLLSCLLFYVLSCLSWAAPERVAILGDSIAYAGGWPTLVTEALRQKPQFADAEIANISVPSETMCGLTDPGHAGGAFPRPCVHDRLARVLAQFKPTVVIAAYGMNDGLMLPLDAVRFNYYQQGAERLKAEVEASGAKIIFITPSPYNIDKEAANGQAAYDKTLEAYGAWLVSRQKKGMKVIDIRPGLKKRIAEEKKKTTGFVFANDGVHPCPKGHEFMGELIAQGLSRFLGTPAKPKLPVGAAFNEAMGRQTKTRNEWLGKTKHMRPQIPGYAPVIPRYKDQDTKISMWNGFEKYDFTFEGRKATIVFPEKSLPGNPWIWRPQFFGYEPIADIAMLGRGFAVAFVDMPDMYGSPRAMKVMDAFYKHVTEQYELSRRPVLEPFSRGGLYAFRWAALNPSRVSAIVANVPVCDMKSWPAGKGKGTGSPSDWQKLLAEYGMTEQQALASRNNPVDMLVPIARAKIPVLIIARTEDNVVPFQENGKILAERYKKLGGRAEVILGPGDHMDKTIKDVSPVVNFILAAAGYPQPVSIVCMGDSITFGAGVNRPERWSSLLAGKLGGGYAVNNQGVSARTLLAKGDHPYTREAACKNALDSKPDIALIALGTNDSKPQNWKHKQDFESDYTAIINGLRKENPKIRIYCLKAIPTLSNLGINGAVIEHEINPVIEETAKKNHCSVIDLFSAMKDHTDLLPDKVHPNAAGHAVMANAIYKEISTLGATGK